MSFFGGGGGGHNHSHSHAGGQQCSHDHGPDPRQSSPYTSMHPGGALGQSESTVVQPGMEMMPMTFGGGGVGGSAGAIGNLVGGGQSAQELQESLKGAPANVLAAAERLSLIPTTSDPAVVRTAPGSEHTDTGELNEATLASQLLVAVRTRDQISVRRLCSTKSEKLEAALKRRDGQGHTLMHWAAKAGDVEMLEVLAESGCPTTEFSQEAVGMAPLHWAATEGRLRASAWLLGPGGADPEGRDNQGCTALVIAAQYGFVELVIFLSNHGCDIAAVDNVGDSAMHWAAYKGHVAVLSMLVKAGQNPETEDSYGQTPLHLAALRGNLDAAEYLVMEARANVSARDKKNETPLDLALNKQQGAMELFLRTSGAGSSWTSPGVFCKVASTPRVWRAVCETGEGVQGARWPLILNLLSMMGVMWIVLARFFGEEYVELGHDNLLTTATIAQFLLWITFLLTWISNPGYVDSSDPALAGAFHDRISVLNGSVGGDGVAINSASGDTDMEGAMDSLLGLESVHGSLSLRACYVCEVEQPLRSKHCRSCRRCVRAIDHHCPFVGNCVGASNYRWFFAYVVFLDISCVLYVAMCIDWLWHLGFSTLIAFSCVYVVFFTFFGGVLFLYHLTLVRTNLTTNEHRNLINIDYLVEPNGSGQYYNPFDLGCVGNFLARFAGTYDTPPAELMARLRGAENSRAAEMGNFV